MTVRITCINKSGGYHDNPHEAITSLGWVNEETKQTGRSTRLDMYDFVVNKQGKAFVRDEKDNVAYLQGATSAAGNKYVRTYGDGKWSDNLLALPECG